MSDQDDDSQNYALMVLAGVIMLVIGLVIGLAIWKGGPEQAPAAATATAASTTAVAEVVAGDADGRIYFELGSDALPAEANDVLTKVVELMRAQPGKTVLISGFHDASGDAATNAELAKKRAIAVRDALVAAGAPADHLVLDKPMVTQGGADARDARRVEMRVR